MTKMGNRRMWISLGLVLILGVLAAGSAQAGLFGIFGHSKSKAASAPKEFLVVFPFDQVVVGNVPDTFGQDVASSLRSLLSDNRAYSALLYTDRLSSIKREGLAAKEVSAPFCEDRAKPHRLAAILATKYYVIGEVQEVQIDQAKKIAQVTLSADLYLLKNGESKLMKTLLVTGKTPDSTKATEVDELRALAAGDAVSKLAVDLAKSAEAEKTVAPTAEGTVAGSPEAVSAEEPAPAK